MSAFGRGSKNIVKRLGKMISAADGDGNLREFMGVFTNPEDDQIVQGRGGGLEFKLRQPKLLVLTHKVAGLNDQWRIFINGIDYHPADHTDDDFGCTDIVLTKCADHAQEGVWR